MARCLRCGAGSEWLEGKPPTKSDACEWTQDADDGSWDTACGNKFYIENGTPEENDMLFCCYCGATLMTPNAELTGRASAACEGPR